MKLSVGISGFLLSLVIIVYVMAFTPVGNTFVAPAVEEAIKEQTQLNSKLKKFSLTMSSFDIVVELNEKNTLYLNGDYSLFSQTFDISYKVELENLKILKPLTNIPLQGSFHTNGKVKGDMNFMKIDGLSDVAKSNTAYHIELKELNPTSIIAKVKELKLDELLYMLNKSAYASSDINLDINFKNITPHAMDGDISLRTKKGRLNTKVMKSDFNVTIPKTAFSMKLDAKLKGDDVEYIYLLSSNLAKVTSSGSLTPQPLKMDVKYGMDIKELAVLKPLTNVDVKGNLKLKGTLKGTEGNLINKLNMNGKLNNKYLTKVYKFESLMPKFKYALNMQNNIKSKDIETALNLKHL